MLKVMSKRRLQSIHVYHLGSPYVEDARRTKRAVLSMRCGGLWHPHRPVPMTGSKARRVISAAHKSAGRIPRNQNISPPSDPCTNATTTLPLTVALITVVNLL